MSKDTKGALIVIVIAILITVGIFFITRGRGEKTEKVDEDVETIDTEKKEQIEDKTTTSVKEEYADVLTDGTKLNKSEEVKKVKTYDGMEFKDLQVTSKNKGTMVVGTITNTSKEEKGDYTVYIKMVDKKGKEIGKVPVYIKKLEAGESMQISSTAQGDMSNSYDYTIEKRD